MKKNLLLSISSLLIAVLMLYSCQKETLTGENEILTGEKDVNISDALKPSDLSKNNCRLVFTDYNGGFFTDDYLYNTNGLVSNFKNHFLGNIYVYANMQYDTKGRLVTGTISYDDVTYYDVVFEYDKDRIVKETVYEHSTSTVVDQTFNTYNQKGQIIRRDDPIYDLYTTFEYDAVGNNLTSELRFIGSNFLVVRNVFNYDMHIKNPSTARPGLPSYNWWYINEVISPFEHTEWDEYWGDGEGGEYLAGDEDPAKTVINPTMQNHALNRLGYDNISGTEHYQYWEYENCGGKNGSVPGAHNPILKMDQRAMDIAKLRMPLIRGPQLQKQLAERRSILQRLKK
jgi:hypothetical protein